MRLWRLGKTASNAHARYAAVDDASSHAIFHLFRALLRQCTYLPDPAARQYLHDHIVSRFRDYHPRSTLPFSSRRHKSAALVQQRLPSLLRTARRGLVFLRRANDGHVRHLGRILAMTYGRIGKRRHQLLKDLKIPDVPVDQAAVEKLSEPGNQAVPHPSEKLMALIKSQARRRLSHFSRINTPHLEPEIPEVNSWGRPMPIKRVRNYKRRWYAEALDRIMPPLPEAEWDRLRLRASGQSPWEGPVARRKWAGGPDDEGQTHLVGERVKSPSTGTCSNPHKITSRYMRRLWEKISAQCPLMKPNAARKSGWDVLWGEVQGHDTTHFTLGPRGGGGYDMFGGVDESGRVLAQGQSPE
ncbi:MAG: hypothetical protein ALECFALPRED_004782 [Alectoria fallacina]|uniref:LYR motif-containing protein Cup1-like N-terminal domain-containing protein n=1 Tax=Alectoria fallacina TaxID=1903189 RepID=A0A8H3G0M7_9LECA|nr:MAG: hypothetical protein ALECFALPRED_004782 [Alectoria fallacina]